MNDDTWAMPAFELTDDHKRRFADAFLKNPGKPFDAALLVWPDNTAIALWASKFLPTDPAIIVWQHKLKEARPDDYLPSKEEAARKIWEWVEGRAPTKEHIDSMRLYCELQGYVIKPTAGAAATSVMPPKFLFKRREPKPDNGSDSGNRAVESAI